MYLSRLVLNMANRNARRDIGSAYDMHRTIVTRGFKEHGIEPGRMLFRIEPTRESQTLGGPVVLVQSTEKPDLRSIDIDYCLKVEGPRPFEPRLAKGMLLSFRLVANPIIKTVQVDHEGNTVESDSGHPRHRRRGILDEEGQRQWLERRGAQGGFLPRFVTISTLSSPCSRPSVITHERKHTIPVLSVRFDGVVEVTDASAMVETLRKGIGPAKAFGCGLLSIARF